VNKKIREILEDIISISLNCSLLNFASYITIVSIRFDISGNVWLQSKN